VARWIICLWVLSAIWLGAGCSPEPSPAPGPGPTLSPPATNTDRRAAAQTTLDAIAVAVQHHDRHAYLATVSPADAGFTEPSGWLFDNLAALPLTSLGFQAEGPVRELTATRAVTIPDGWLQRVRVTWELTGDAAPAQHEVWLTFAGTSALLAGTTDAPPDSARTARPLWLLEPITVAHAGVVTIVTGRPVNGRPVNGRPVNGRPVNGRPATSWPAPAQVAAAAVRSHLSAGLGHAWSGDLVIEIPSNEATLEQVLGAASGSYAQIAAVTLPEGPDPATSAIRIIVNADLAYRLTADGLALLLTHEATHVATRSADSPAPIWLVEGFADYVAYQTVPSAKAAGAAGVVAEVKAHGAPRTLPSNSRFTPTADHLDLTYGQSWLACRFVAEKFSPAQLNHLYVAADAGQPIGDAIHTTLGITESAFLARWQTYLRQLAAHG
jgi:hypothetical protein